MLRRSRGRPIESSGEEESESEVEEQILEAKPKKKGRLPIAPKWTGVLKFEEFMDDEPEVQFIIKDKNRLLEEIEDDLTVIREKKGLVLYHNELDEEEDDLRLTNYKSNKPELEVLAK